MNLVQCVTSRVEDVPAIVECHMRSFPASLSTRLGPRFTGKMLEWYAVAERGVLFHIVSDGVVAGYCGGIRTLEPGLPGAFTSITQFAFFPFVGAFARRPWLLFHPELRPKLAGIVRNVMVRCGLRSVRRSVDSATREAFRPFWGLVVIGVDPRFRRSGHGGTLLREFEERARAEKMGEIRLTVKSSNTAAVALYQRNGWQLAETSQDCLLLKKCP